MPAGDRRQASVILERPIASPARDLAHRKNQLRAWIAVQVVLALGGLVGIASTTDLRPDIALRSFGLPAELVLPAGLVFWLAFGLLGGIRAHLRPGGTVLTFSMPFIVAGTMLGGPLAGALMGLISEFEVRELRTKPWYGALANHSVSILAAIAAAFVGGPVRTVLEAALPGAEQVAFFVSAMTMALVFTTVNVLLLIPTMALRHGLTLREASRAPDVGFRAIALVEAILAWNMAASYIHIGWWAPIACAALVLVMWQAHDAREVAKLDERTGLLNDAGLRPRLEAAIDAASSGRRPAALIVLDLNDFFEVNEAYGLEGGDEVLVTVARRLLMAVRATDSVARLNRAGDEFALLLDGVADVEVAAELAGRVKSRIGEPIQLRRSAGAVVHVGAAIGICLIESGTTLASADVIATASRREAQAKDSSSGIVWWDADRGAAVARRIEDKRARRREPRRIARREMEDQ
jgi:diguanylate cyclase (GGDEF)-like protein